MSDILDTLYDEIPEEDTRLFEVCDEISDRIAAALAAKGWTQRQLAAALGKRESYVSRALAGGVNFTMRTLVQFELALSVQLLHTSTRNEDAATYTGPTLLSQPGARVELYSREIPRTTNDPLRALAKQYAVNDYSSVTAA